MDKVRRWIQIAALADFGDSRKLVRECGGISLLLCRIGGEVVAVSNMCTHLGKPLDSGRLMSGRITCPFHGACFDLASGAALSGPAVSPLKTYQVRTEQGQIMVEMSVEGDTPK